MRSETEKMLSEGLYSGSAWKECAERIAGMALPRMMSALPLPVCALPAANVMPLRRKSRS